MPDRNQILRLIERIPIDRIEEVLTNAEFDVMSYMYIDEDQLSIEDTAAQCDVSPSRIKKVHKSAIRKLNILKAEMALEEVDDEIPW